MALNATSVTSAATNVAPVAVPSTSETVADNIIGVNGALLNVINGAGAPITVTLADPGTTGLGNAGTVSAQSVTNATDRWFRISPGHVNRTTGAATVTFSAITSITYKLIPC